MRQGYTHGACRKTYHLQQQGPHMPSYGFKVVRGHFYELEKQQDADKPSLSVSRNVVAYGPYGPQRRSEMVDKV